jgi:hypothetical protein
VSTEHKIFYWYDTLVDSLRSFRGAVIRWGYAFKRMHEDRVDNHLTEIAPEKERQKYESLVEVQEDGTYALTPAFNREIKRMEDDADRLHGGQRAQPPPGGAAQPAAPQGQPPPPAAQPAAQ